MSKGKLDNVQIGSHYPGDFGVLVLHIPGGHKNKITEDVTYDCLLNLVLLLSNLIHSMQTLTIQIKSNTALKVIHALQEKKAISIVENAELNMDSPALPGQPLTLKAFKSWIAQAEAAPSVTLKEAQSKWAKQRRQLQRVTK